MTFELFIYYLGAGTFICSATAVLLGIIDRLDHPKRSRR